jgi:hypothetical protein
MKTINGDRDYILALKKLNRELSIALVCVSILLALAVVALWQTETLLLKLI